MPGFAFPKSFSSLQVCSKLAFSVPTTDLFYLESLLFFRGAGRTGIFLLLSGVAHSDSLSSPFVLDVTISGSAALSRFSPHAEASMTALDVVQLDSFSALQFLSRPGPLPIATDLFQLDTASSLRSAGQSDALLTASGISRSRFLFSSFMLDTSCLDVFVFLRSLSRLRVSSFASDLFSLDVFSPTRSFGCVRSLLYTSGVS